MQLPQVEGKMKLAWDSKHRKEGKAGYDRVRSADPYHSSRWTKLSRVFREQHPLCAECKRKGLIVPATCVDHIIPYPICQDFFDESNLQALCDRCNMLKGAADRNKIIAYKQSKGR